MIPEKILICGVVKNVAKFLHMSIDRCHNTGAMFEDYKIVIYENNSTDDTKNILALYESNPKYKIISEEIPYDVIKTNSRIWAFGDHPCRIEQICNARNKVIDEINKPEYNSFTYVLWVDLDTDYWSLDGIRDAFECKQSWDVVYANGIEGDMHYFDMYAFRDRNHYLCGAELLGDLFWKENALRRFILDPNSNQLIRVVSAFGGMGIFKKSIFKNIKYDCVANDNVKAYYRQLLDTTQINESQRHIIATDCSTFPGGCKDDTHNIHWKFNSGYKNIVVCEHVCLNFELYNKGYRVFIYPKLIYLHK